jgi:hypothetical protein
MKRLSIVPLFLALMTLGALLLDAGMAPTWHRAVLVTACLLAGLSAFVTTARFSPGDRLFACWGLIGAAYVIAGVRHGTRLLSMTVLPAAALPTSVGTALMIAQNAFITISLLLFVLAWRATGLAAPGSRAAQIGSVVAGIVIAVAVGGYPLMSGLAAAKTDPAMIISTLGDVVGLALIVPLALPALAMRGGLLMHTWVYLALSEVGWLLYDIWWALTSALEMGRSGSAILEAMRVAAIGFAIVASVAQRRALGGWSEEQEREVRTPAFERPA